MLLVKEGICSTIQQPTIKLSQFLQISKHFRIYFFPYCIKEWSKLNDTIRNIESINRFKVTVLKVIITPKANSVFGVHDTNGISY